jgi:hypothetical protein
LSANVRLNPAKSGLICPRIVPEPSSGLTTELTRHYLAQRNGGQVQRLVSAITAPGRQALERNRSGVFEIE